MIARRLFANAGRSRLLVGSVGALLGGTIVGGLTLAAAHGGDTTQIHACLNPAGALRIVGATVTCRSSETALDWSIQGVKGDQGSQGVKGDQGVQGPSGFLGIRTVEADSTAVSYSFHDADAECGADEVVTGGGTSADWVEPGVALPLRPILVFSGPSGHFAGGNRQGWFGEWFNPSLNAEHVAIRTWAICMKVTP